MIFYNMTKVESKYVANDLNSVFKMKTNDFIQDTLIRELINNIIGVII